MSLILLQALSSQRAERPTASPIEGGLVGALARHLAEFHSRFAAQYLEHRKEMANGRQEDKRVPDGVLVGQALP